MNKIYTVVLTFILLVSFNLSSAQEECTTRYKEKMFKVGMKGNVHFGEWITPRGGIKPLRYDVYFPKDDTSSALRPLVILWHGGAYLDMFTKESPDIVMMSKDLARMGYVAISPDYRGVRDIADMFNDDGLIKEVAGSAIDANKAVCHILDQIDNGDNPFRINKDEIFAGGVSGGAVTGLHALLLNNLDDLGPKYAAYAREVDNGAADEMITNKFCGFNNAIKGFINISGGILDTSFIKYTPVSFLNIHGTADNIVMFDYGKPLGGVTSAPALYGSKPVHEKLEQLGVRSETLFSKGLGHVPFMNLDLGSILKYGLGLINDENYELTMNVIADFLFDQITCEKAPATPTGIRNIEFAQLSFYPNPIGSQFQITMAESKDWQLQIFDLSGRMIVQNSFQGLTHSQSTEKVSAGMYVIQVFDVNQPDKLYTGKIIK